MKIFSLLTRENREKDAKERAFRKNTEGMLTSLAGEMKKQQELLETLSREVQQNGADIRQAGADVRQAGADVRQTGADVRQTGADVRRHDMALEDCLEAIEEQQEEERQSSRQIRKLEEEQEKLLRLLGVYREQLWDMKRYAEQKEPSWLLQLDLAEKAAQGSRLSCGLAWIEETGVKVDYDLHEVIEARAADGEEQDMQVAEIYSPGYIYQGTVKKKAKVAAYRLEKDRTGV